MVNWSEALNAPGLWSIAVFLLHVIAMSGCATTYEASKEGEFGSGYSEKRVTDGVYWLRFNGLQSDDLENIIPLWNKRVVELCGENNYSATPEKLINDSVIMMYTGARYPESLAYPYVQGNVVCKDKQLARRIGPLKYNPSEDFYRLKLKTITLKHAESNNGLVQNFSNYVNDQLKRYGPYPVVTGKYEMNILIGRFIANAWMQNVTPAGMSGGVYVMESYVTILDAETNHKVGENKITTSISARGDAESRLKHEHAIDIVEYAVSVFP